MFMRAFVFCPAAMAAVLAAGALLAAEGKGQGDLDKATEAKLSASTFSDFTEVIRLAESAMQKGLDATNTEFAKRLLGSVYLERAQATTKQLSGELPAADFQQRRQLALADVEKSLKFESRQPQAYFLLARLKLGPGGKDIKEVVAALDKAIELGGEDPVTKARALLFRAALTEQPDKKRSDLDQAVSLMPDDPSFVYARGKVLAELGKLDQALLDFDKSIALDPNNGTVYEDKAVVLAYLKKFSDAVAALEKARELNPRSLSPLLRLARVHSQQGNFGAAIEDLNQAMRIHPSDVGLLLLRAEVYQEKGDKKKALAELDEVLKLKPNLAAVVRARALFLAQDNRLDEAISELEKLSNREPKDAATLFQLGLYYTMKKNSPKAIETYQKLLELAPKDERVRRGLADALLNVGRQAEAIKEYEIAMKADPKDEGVLNNLAWVLCTSPDDKLRNGRRALELAAEVCKQTGYKQPHILSTLAAAYAELGDFDNAAKWIEKGLEIAKQSKAAGKDDQETSKETIESLEKELINYKAKKPTRELLSEGKAEAGTPEKK